MGEQGTGDIERRLAAILALDVVGFSRMMGADETGTLERLKTIRAEIIDPAITAAHGRIVKLMGDGMLVEFDSAVNAVQCGIDVQDQLHQRNKTVAEAEAMTLRMGINLGDVIIEGDDIYGDGVNIAARLEAIADVGGIFVSASIQDSAHNKVSADFEDLGDKQLKNIDHPVRVYRVDIQGASPATANTGMPRWIAAAALTVMVVGGGALIWTSMKPGVEVKPASVEKPQAQQQDAPKPDPEQAMARPDKPTIAVLPFNNFSDDKDQEYFSDGLTEDLITDISKVSGVRVIARNSTFSYKGKSQDVRAVGKELGASHVIEGSVRKAGGTVRINVQLINAADGNHIWAERYDRELKDIFAIQDEVIGKIIAQLAVKLTEDEKTRLAKHETENIEAHDLLLRGRQQESFFTPTANAEAVEYFKRAIALDPEYAEANAHLSVLNGIIATFGNVKNADELISEALKYAEKAVALDPNLPLAQFALGRILARPQVTQYPRALEAFNKAIALDPNHVDSYANLAFVSTFTGNAARAKDLIETAMRMNPHYPFWYLFARAQAHYLLGDFDKAVEDLTEAAERNPTVVFVRYWLAAALAQADQVDDAEWALEELRGMGHTQTREQYIITNPITFPAYREKLDEGLKKAGLE